MPRSVYEQKRRRRILRRRSLFSCSGRCFLYRQRNEAAGSRQGEGNKRIYSVRGLTTYRLNSPRFAPNKDNLLKIDVFCDETSEITFTIEDSAEKEVYKYSQSIIGGVWQSLILESKLFKTGNGVQLTDYAHNLRFCISCDGEYAVNNLMWL